MLTPEQIAAFIMPPYRRLGHISLMNELQSDIAKAIRAERCNLDYYKALAVDNGFKSITHAITQARKARS